MLTDYLTPTAQTKIKRTRGPAHAWVRFFSLARLETFFIGRNEYTKTGFARARRDGAGKRISYEVPQYVNVNPLNRFRSNRPLKKA